VKIKLNKGRFNVCIFWIRAQMDLTSFLISCLHNVCEYYELPQRIITYYGLQVFQLRLAHFLWMLFQSGYIFKNSMSWVCRLSRKKWMNPWSLDHEAVCEPADHECSRLEESIQSFIQTETKEQPVIQLFLKASKQQLENSFIEISLLFFFFPPKWRWNETELRLEVPGYWN